MAKSCRRSCVFLGEERKSEPGRPRPRLCIGSFPPIFVRDYFHWRDLRGLGKLLAYGFSNQFQYARSRRWKRHHEFRHGSSPIR
jgi:hypothetical protein